MATKKQVKIVKKPALQSETASTSKTKKAVEKRTENIESGHGFDVKFSRFGRRFR